MKILYVTPFLRPLTDILSGKTEHEISTSAFFFYPWYKLVKKGHQVDFVSISNFKGEYNIKVDWFTKENILVNIYDPPYDNTGFFRIFRKIKRFLLLIYHTNKVLQNNKYDFVYCKAFEGLAGNIAANIKGVPCGVRSFGTTAYPAILKYGKIGAAIRRPLEFLTYRTNKEFLLVTNDGSDVEKVYESWRPKRKNYDYYAWRTGIKFEDINEINADIKLPEHDYLFFPARFHNWKRHDRVVKILNIMHRKGFKIHLYFAGPVDSKGYFEKIQKLIKKFDLELYVHFLGVIPQQILKLYSYSAVANFIVYDYSNTPNVLFEMLSVGSLIIGINDGKINEFIEHNKNGFLIDDEESAASVIEQLINKKYDIKLIRKNAIDTAKEKVMTIDERFDMEVELIESVVKNNRII